ncbi:MAG: hypothetical protein J6N52_05020 [Clostridia bacterium]|nr:hypothetical protein [Clostridia bacterium]
MTSSLCGTYIEKAGENIPYDMTIEYYMTEELLCSRYSDLKRYGVIVKKTCSFPDGTATGEEKQINDIFYRKSDADDFLDMLIRNRVTPMAVEEIIQEYICNKLVALR